jgi:hypothetical protein
MLFSCTLLPLLSCFSFLHPCPFHSTFAGGGSLKSPFSIKFENNISLPTAQIQYAQLNSVCKTEEHIQEIIFFRASVLLFVSHKWFLGTMGERTEEQVPEGVKESFCQLGLSDC